MNRSQATSESGPEQPKARTRRWVIAGLGLLSGGLLARTTVSSVFAANQWDKTDPDDDDEREDSDDSGNGSRDFEGQAGVALLHGWMAGDIRDVPISDPSWVFLISQVSNYAFYAPPDWSFAETYDQTPRGFDFGYITTGISVSADGEATFLVFDFNLFKDVMEMDQFIEMALEELAGNDPIEIVAEQSWSYLAEDDARFTAARIGDQIVTMQVFGSILSNPAAGIETSSYSSTIQFADADRFDDFATDYFLPMLSSFQRFSGGSGEQTPTPSPTP